MSFSESGNPSPEDMGLMAVSPRDNERNEKSVLNRERLMGLVNELLVEWDNPDVLGVVLFGSRMDKSPSPRFTEKSDIDCFIVGSRNIAQSRKDFFRHMEGKGIDPKSLQVGAYTLKSLDSPVPEAFAWLWDPQEVQFVSRQGSMLQLTPEDEPVDYQQILMDFIQSPRVAERRAAQKKGRK